MSANELLIEMKKGFTSFAVDSREVKAGGLFFALKGLKSDGHHFLEEVALRGALAAAVSEEYEGESFGLKLIRVPDVKEALHRLARSVWSLRKTRVIGVTGSVGKTTTKEFLAELLSGRFRVARTEGSRNSQASFPLELLHADPEAEWMVAEMGMSEGGEISRLVDMAPPELVVITPITICHLAQFKNFDGIIDAKAEIFSRGASHAFVHKNSAELKRFRDQIPSSYEVYDAGDLPAYTPFKESHFRENFAAALSVCRYLGLSEEEIEQRIKRLKPYYHRFEKKEHEGVVYIDDSYNANPLTMKTSLANAPKPEPGGRFIAILGSMGELGPLEEEAHLDLGKFALNRVDYLFCLGPLWEATLALFQETGKPAEHFNDHDLLKKRLLDYVKPGDVVLLKGSNRFKMWKIIDFIS